MVKQYCRTFQKESSERCTACALVQGSRSDQMGLESRSRWTAALTMHTSRMSGLQVGTVAGLERAQFMDQYGHIEVRWGTGKNVPAGNL